MGKNQTKKVFVIAFFFLLGLFSLTIFAQDKKSDLETKLDQLKGNVERLTVKVDGKDVVFEGKDAQDLAQKLRTFGKLPNIVWLSDGNEKFESKDGNVFMYRFNKKDGKIDVDAKGEENKKVEVRIEDGKKKVTVTTNKDGKEETKTYEGEEADKFLRENEKVGKYKIMIDDEAGSGDKMIFFNKKLDDDDCCCCKGRMRIKHFSPGAVKKIIIEKIEKDTKEDKKEKK